MTEIQALCSEFTMSDRYQTIIPELVCKALGLNKRDKVAYAIQDDGRLIISRADQSQSDHMLGRFLNLLAQDIKKNSQHLQAIDSDLVNRVQSLVSGVDIDLNAPLSDEDE